MFNNNHLLVVKTSEISKTSTTPEDAVIGIQYWHIGDQDWLDSYYASVEKLIYHFVKENSWQLIQWTVLNKPHEHELIFSCPKSDFEEVVSLKSL